MILDKNTRVPLSVTIHLLRCRKCRKFVESMAKVKDLSKKQFSSRRGLDKEFMSRTMQKIDLLTPDLMKIQAEKHKLPPTRFLPWISLGVLMILGLSSIPFTSMGKWAAQAFQLKFVIPTSLISALLVSIYAAIFVGRNLDFFIKKFDFL